MEEIMKLTDKEYEAWMRFAQARAAQLYPNGHTNSALECAEFADTMIEKMRSRYLLEDDSRV